MQYIQLFAKKETSAFLSQYTLPQIWRHSGALTILKQTRAYLSESYLLRLPFQTLPPLTRTILYFYAECSLFLFLK